MLLQGNNKFRTNTQRLLKLYKCHKTKEKVRILESSEDQILLFQVEGQRAQYKRKIKKSEFQS